MKWNLRKQRRRKLHLRTLCVAIDRVAFSLLCKCCATKIDFSHQEMHGLSFLSMQHAIMTLDNLSGIEITTAENVIHVVR